MKKLSLALVLMLLLALPVFGLAESETQESPEATPAATQQAPAYGRGRFRKAAPETAPQGRNFTDANNDGVCDNCEENFVDLNKDGICDNCAQASGGRMTGRNQQTKGRGNKAQSNGRGNRAQAPGRGNQAQTNGQGGLNRNQSTNPNFVDSDNDGVCDHFQNNTQNNTQRPGRGGAPGRRHGK